jgi:hypothetical protein
MKYLKTIPGCKGCDGSGLTREKNVERRQVGQGIEWSAVERLYIMHGFKFRSAFKPCRNKRHYEGIRERMNEEANRENGRRLGVNIK